MEADRHKYGVFASEYLCYGYQGEYKGSCRNLYILEAAEPKKSSLLRMSSFLLCMIALSSRAALLNCSFCFLLVLLGSLFDKR